MTPTDPATPGEESLASARGYLRFLARHQLGDDLQAKGDVSDLVQATLLTAHENRDQFRGTSQAEYKCWLRRILVNVARQFRRYWRRQARAASREVPLATQPASQDSPSRVVRQQERHRLLADAVGRLPEVQRQVVTLRVEEDLSFGEIGSRLGKSADAVRMLFNRALAVLQGRVHSDEALS